MADFYKSQKKVSLGEIRTFDWDVTNDLRGSATVSTAVAVCTPPSGAAPTVAVGTIVANVVPVTVSAFSVLGTHFLDVTATLSDGEKSVVRIQFDVIF